MKRSAKVGVGGTKKTKKEEENEPKAKDEDEAEKDQNSPKEEDQLLPEETTVSRGFIHISIWFSNVLCVWG